MISFKFGMKQNLHLCFLLYCDVYLSERLQEKEQMFVSEGD